MKRFVLLLSLVLVGISMINAQTPKETEDLWDFVSSFRTSTGRQYGVATDGQFIYTCAWGSSSTVVETFYKYDFEGNLLEDFSIPGCPFLRDMTYDGQYFYAGSAEDDGSGTLYCFDLANKTLVGSISTPCPSIRHCSYDPVNDGFWIGESTSLMLVNRNGTLITSVPNIMPDDNTFCDGTGYFMDEDGVSHLFMMCNVGIHPYVYDYNITNSTFVSTPVLNFENTPGYIAYGGAGGAFVGVYDGRTYFFGDEQSSPNMIAIYDLGEGEPPIPPTPHDGDYFYDFENGHLEWTLIDADGDGHNWEMKSYGVLGSQCCVTSSSNYGGEALTPNNYMVSPVKDYYDQIWFKVCPQDEYYVGEHIGVAISSQSNTNPNDFVTVWETTLTGSPTEWEEVEVNLSAYGGQELWVAIRHFNCTNQFWVNVDDITLFLDPTGLVETDAAQFNIYPNPASDKLTVTSEETVDRCDVFSVTGALLYSCALGTKSFDLDVATLPAGMYFIRLNTENKTMMKKFMKN